MKNPALPDFCYSVNLTTNAVIVLKNGIRGYFPSDITVSGYDAAEAIATEKNAVLGVSEAERKAMDVGSMFGWDSPGCDPEVFRKKGIA